MPFIDINPTAGPLTVEYIISTPTNPDADAIDPCLPTVIFLHGLWFSMLSFEFQWRDRNLRRFNLVALNCRGHGKTGPPGSVPPTWSEFMASDDLYHFIKALNLPPCHFVSMSMGTLVAGDLLRQHRDMVISECFISPIPDVTDEAAALAGKQEIYDCWAAIWEDPNNPDPVAVGDSQFGGAQFAFNNMDTPFIRHLVDATMKDSTINFGYGRLDQAYNVAVGFFKNLPPWEVWDRDIFRDVPCLLIRGDQDIAYPPELSEGFMDMLRKTGAKAEYVEVPGATHFACVTAPEKVNAVIHDWLLKNIQDPPPIPESAISPWAERLGDYEKTSSDDGSSSDSDS